MKKLALAVSFLSFSTSALSQEVSAPFGFEWSETVEQVQKKGVTLTDCKNISGILICQTSNPPKSVSFEDFYKLFFDENSGLHKIEMIGKDIKGDSSGNDGKKLYSNIKNSLINKYDPPKSFETVGHKLYDKYDEFYQCLKYDGCGYWKSYWVPKEGGTIALSLNGMKRGEGYIKLGYESKEWDSVVDRIKSNKAKKDSDAL